MSLSVEPAVTQVRLLRALRHFDLDVEFAVTPGEVVVVVGPSGAGKTSILNCVAGLDTPDGGRICLGDHTVFDAATGVNVRPEAREVGYVFQDYALFPHLTVRRNVVYGLQARGRSPAESGPRVEALLELLRIRDLANAYPAQLSGGEQQRVALARALAIEPKVLLLDEPLAALDTTSRKHVRRELRQLLRQLDVAVILVTHDYEDALVLGRRILVMERGRVSRAGSHEELLQHPRSRFVADFTGVNYFEGTVEAGGDQPRQVRIGSATLHAVTDLEGEVSVSFFPSDVTLSTAEPHTSARNLFRGPVREVANLGGRLRVQIDAALPVVADITPDAYGALGLHEGTPVYVAIKATSIRVSE
jgi:molybdate transport system ATP-binding protein